MPDLPKSIVGTIFSFVAHGHDEDELSRLASVSEKSRLAIKANPTLFNTDEPLLEIQGHKDESLNGVWYLKRIKTRTFTQSPGMDAVPGAGWRPNPYRPIQYAEFHHKQYTFVRESCGKEQEIAVMSGKISPKHFRAGFGPNSYEPDTAAFRMHRMARYEDDIYDIHLSNTIEAVAPPTLPLFHDNDNGMKLIIGMDIRSERCNRTLRFLEEQIPHDRIRSEDRYAEANYTPFASGAWIEFSTLLEPIFDPELIAGRKKRQAEVSKKMEDSAKKLGVSMATLSPEEQIQFQQSAEYQAYVAEMTTLITELQNASQADFSDDQMACAWDQGEKMRYSFRIRLFDSRSKTI